MAVIQSGASATQWTIDTTSDAGRVTFYDTNGNPMSNVSSLNNVLNALNAAVTITLGGQATAGITVAGTTGSLTLSFEATIDNINWFSISATPIPVAATVTSTSTNGQWIVDLGGFYGVRARISAFTSGSMTVSVVVTPQNSKNTAQAVTLAGTIPVSGTVTSNQGTANTIGNSWPVEMTDGTNILGTTAHPVKIDPTGTTTQPVSISGTVPVSGTVTANQGTAAALSGHWPVQVTDGTNTMPTGDAVGRAIFEKLTDGTNTAAVKAASTPAVAVDPALVVALSPNNTPFQFGGDDRLRVGQETFLLFDNIDGANVDVNKWTQSQLGMTQTQTGGSLTLNAGSSLTAGNYSILSSNRQMFIMVEFPLYVQFRAKLIPQTNAVIELGFGNVSAATAPSDGCFFRVDTAGNVKGVINFATAETTTANLFTINSTTFYNWEVTIFEDHVDFEVQSADGSVNIDVELPIPSTQGSPVSVGHLPIFARVYNNTAPGAAAQMVIASVNAQQMDLATYKPWAEQMSGIGRHAMFDPVALAQSDNYTNSTVPATATLSNTAAGYTTLGGSYKFAAVAGAETDYALFAYQVPTGYQLNVTGISINTFVTGAASSTSATILQWAVAANSSAVSLATGAPNPPLFMPIGVQTAPKTAAIGDLFDPGLISYTFRTPIAINSGKFFHVVLRIPIGNATASQIIRGNVMIEGYFE